MVNNVSFTAGWWGNKDKTKPKEEETPVRREYSPADLAGTVKVAERTVNSNNATRKYHTFYSLSEELSAAQVIQLQNLNQKLDTLITLQRAQQKPAHDYPSIH